MYLRRFCCSCYRRYYLFASNGVKNLRRRPEIITAIARTRYRDWPPELGIISRIYLLLIPADIRAIYHDIVADESSEQKRPTNTIILLFGDDDDECITRATHAVHNTLQYYRTATRALVRHWWRPRRVTPSQIGRAPTHTPKGRRHAIELDTFNYNSIIPSYPGRR